MRVVLPQTSSAAVLDPTGRVHIDAVSNQVPRSPSVAKLVINLTQIALICGSNSGLIALGKMWFFELDEVAFFLVMGVAVFLAVVVEVFVLVVQSASVSPTEHVRPAFGHPAAVSGTAESAVHTVRLQLKASKLFVPAHRLKRH